MAKNYKRHSQGKGFRKSDFGDMGLRAYRDQQQTIINSLKLQNKEFESTRKEFIDSDILKSRKEEENRKELQKLEDDVYDVKFNNTKIRADREIEVLEQQAKESEQKSKFWLDFSSTYAKQYTQAAQDIHGAIDLKRAQNSINQYDRSGAFHENIENSDMLDKLNAAEMQTVMQKYNADPKLTAKELNGIGAHFSDIDKRKWSTRNEGITAKFKEQWKQIQQHAIKTVGERFAVTTENVQDILNIRGLELLNEAGIPWNSKAGYDFMKFVRGKAYDEFNYRSNVDTKIRDDENIKWNQDRYNAALKSGDKYKKEFALSRLSFLHQNKLSHSDGQFGIVPMTEKEGLIATVQGLSEAGIITTPDQIDDILQTPYPGQEFPRSTKGLEDLISKDKRVSWETRYEGTDLRDTLLNTYSTAEKARNKKKEEVKVSTDRADKAEIDAGISKKPGEEGYINLRDIDQMKTLEAKYQGRGNGKAYEYLQELKILGNMGIGPDGAILNSAAFTALAEEGNVKEFKRIVGLLPEETQGIYAPMIESYEFANRVGWDKKGKTKHLQAALSRISGLEDVQQLPPDSDYSRMFNDAEQVFNSLISKYGSNPELNDVQKEEAIARDLRELIGEKDGEGKTPHGSSIFRRQVVGGKLKWLAYRNESTTLTDDSVIYDRLNTKGTENFLKSQGIEKTRLNLFTQDDLDTLHKSSLNNLSLETVIPERIEKLVNTLWFNQPKLNDSFKSRTDILNELLKASGSDAVIPAGEEERDLWVATQIKTNINEYFSYSLEDRQRCAAASEILDLGDTKDCLERITKDISYKQELYGKMIDALTPMKTWREDSDENRKLQTKHKLGLSIWQQ